MFKVVGVGWSLLAKRKRRADGGRKHKVRSVDTASLRLLPSGRGRNDYGAFTVVCPFWGQAGASGRVQRGSRSSVLKLR